MTALYVSYPWWVRRLIRFAEWVNQRVNDVARSRARYTDMSGKRVPNPLRRPHGPVGRW